MLNAGVQQGLLQGKSLQGITPWPHLAFQVTMSFCSKKLESVHTVRCAPSEFATYEHRK